MILPQELRKGMLFNDFRIPIDVSTLQKCIFSLCRRRTQNMKISMFPYIFVLLNEVKE